MTINQRTNQAIGQRTNESDTAADTAVEITARQPGWLWVSAGVLVALILVQGAGLFESTAMAEMSTTSGSYSIMTTDGNNDEILVVVDSRQEALMVYRTLNANKLVMLEREDLSSLFSRARARTLGRP